VTGSLEAKIAAVTGGSTGIGLATAKKFSAEGAFVFIIALPPLLDQRSCRARATRRKDPSGRCRIIYLTSGAAWAPLPTYASDLERSTHFANRFRKEV